MPAICSVCNKACEVDNEAVKCFGKCGNVYHVDCAKSAFPDSFRTRNTKKGWFCDICKPEKSSSASNRSSNTTTALTKEFLLNIFEAFKEEVFKEIKNSVTEFNQFKDSLQFLSDTVDKSNTLLQQISKEYKEIKEENSKLRAENRMLHGAVGKMEVRLRNLEQYSRRSNIEISGVPETPKENLDQLLTDIGRSVGIGFVKDKVVAAHRVPSFRKEVTSPIIVKFCTREEKDLWIANFKKTRPLTANKINASFSHTIKVFINEHLSPENKLLLSKTKEAAKQKNFKYVWSKEGKIFVRREAGQPCRRIDCLDDISNL